MPTYTMKNIESGEVTTVILSLREREEMLASGLFEQQLSTASFVSQTGGTLSKTSGDWRDLLKKVKKEAGRNNTVKV